MSLLFEITILLLAAAIAAPFGKISRIGSVLAFVAIGVLIGPWGLSLIEESEDILHFAEIGVVFLLFIIGLELQAKRLWALRRIIFGAGSIQLALSALVIFGILLFLDFSWQASVVIAYGLALSSTAFALRLIADNNELQSSQGKLAFGVLLFQDLAVIPFLAIMPLLAGVSGTVPEQAGHLPLWAAIGIFIVFILIGHYLLIPFLRLIAWTRVHEAFTATALLLVLGSALIMEEIGLSMGLGAFLAGVLVADSEYRHQLEADIEPFKGLLLGLFFMAVGMSTNIGILADEYTLIFVGVASLLGIKGLVLYLLGRIQKLASRNAARFAAYLCQGGEFGFVAFTLASGYQIISPELKDMLIVIITLSMALTPVVMKLVSVMFREAGMNDKELASMTLESAEHNQIIIAGFGRFGQILGRVLNAQNILYTAVDINPEQVKLVREFGNLVYYGDLSRQALLETAHVGDAKIFALCIDDVEASLHIVKLLKHDYPALKIFCRARNRNHEIKLRELGVDYVIRETLLSSMEFTKQVLMAAGSSNEDASKLLATFQQQDESLIKQQAALIHNKDSMIQSVQDAANELKTLLKDEKRLKPEKGAGSIE